MITALPTQNGNKDDPYGTRNTAIAVLDYEPGPVAPAFAKYAGFHGRICLVLVDLQKHMTRRCFNVQIAPCVYTVGQETSFFGGATGQVADVFPFLDRLSLWALNTDYVKTEPEAWKFYDLDTTNEGHDTIKFGKLYTVETEGQTLGSVARMFNTLPSVIRQMNWRYSGANLNRLDNERMGLQVGEQLCLLPDTCQFDQFMKLPVN